MQSVDPAAYLSTTATPKGVEQITASIFYQKIYSAVHLISGLHLLYSIKQNVEGFFNNFLVYWFYPRSAAKTESVRWIGRA
jgi:hypothetical protein